MKKVILIVVALMMVASGVAAVSAYEAHVVNVTAHVENALDTPAALVIGGSAAFPEEWVEGTITIEASTSFKNQSPARRTEIDYKVCAKPKPADTAPTHPPAPIFPATTPPAGPAHDYIWAGGFTYVSVDTGASWIHIGPAFDEVTPAGPFCPSPNVTGTVTSSTAGSLLVGMDMPVFTAYYVWQTDVPDKPRPPEADLVGPPDTTLPSGNADDPSVISALGLPGGDDYGLDLIIQVTDIR